MEQLVLVWIFVELTKLLYLHVCPEHINHVAPTTQHDIATKFKPGRALVGCASAMVTANVSVFN